jgi:hypothetical protein
MEQVPKKTETIAAKRAERVAEKLKEAHKKLGKSEWWTNGHVEFFAITVIFALNFFLVYPVIGEHAVSTKFSGPVLPLMAKGLSLMGPPFLYSIQIVNIIFFLAFPFTFYMFVKAISGRKFSAFFAILVASLPVFPFAKTRIDFGVLGHDSAYIASLTFLPLALYFLLIFLRKGGVKNLIVATLVNAFMALISPFGFFIYLIMSVITAFSEVLLGDGRLKIMRLLSVYIFSASLTSFWYNPVFFFWMLTGPLGEDVRIMLRKLIPVSFFTIPVLATFGYLIFDRKPSLQPFFIALFYTIGFLIFVLAGGGLVPASPGRYTPVLGISIALLVGITILKVVEFMRNRFTRFFVIPRLKDFLLLGMCGVMAVTIFLWRDAIYRDSDQVLGAFDDIEKGQIWVAKDYFAGKYSILGGTISFLGASALTFMYVNYKKFARQA